MYASDTAVHGPVGICKWYRGTWTSGYLYSSDTEVLGLVEIYMPVTQRYLVQCIYASYTEVHGPEGMHMPVSYVDQWACICQWHRATWTSGHAYASDTELRGPMDIHTPVTQRYMDQWACTCQWHRGIWGREDASDTELHASAEHQAGKKANPGMKETHWYISITLDQILSSFQCPIHSATDQYPWRPSTAAQMTGDTMQGNKGKPLALSPNLTQGFLPNEQQNAKQKHKQKEKEAS